MAKCIRIVGQGVPVRMSDADAFQIVERDKDGEYCSKRFWRNWYAPHPDFPDKVVREPVCVKVGRGEVASLHFNTQHKRRAA